MHGELNQALQDAMGNTDVPSLIDVRVESESIPTFAEWNAAR